MDKSLQQCLELLKENEDQIRNDAEGALLTICQNILSHPNDKQYRKVLLDDPLVIQKLLPATGAMECLFDIGFVEATDCLSLPQEVPLTKLQALESLLAKNAIKANSSKVHTDKSAAYDLLPQTCSKREKEFLTGIIVRSKSVLRYEDERLQEKARKIIPFAELELATMKRMRELQKHMKLTEKEKTTKKEYTEDDIEDVKELFLMELLHWFKYEFFSWVEGLKCSTCSSECKYEMVVESHDPRCSRIEIQKCPNCGTMVKFPRYCDPEPLLISRRGRCGEWANVFTLFCRALGYDARFVHDETDHVWTEVWSMREKRWIHVDPCEDVMDRPLMYEKGWKKKLTYVIAFSKDEIQDVTWRYTRDLPGVLKRRKLCSETKLLEFIESLNKYRQSSHNYSPSRKQYVIKRRLMELVELLHVPKGQNSDDDDNNYQGRSTGSYEWKLARGEISQANVTANYSWDVSKYGDTFHLCYFVVQDEYRVINNDCEVIENISGWQHGVYETQGGIFRKLEHDWKMVYLARSPGTGCGKVEWNLVVLNQNLCIKTVSLKALVTVFHEASISWEIEGFFDKTDQTKSTIFPINDCTNYYTEELKGSIKLIIRAKVSGGQGDSAWQHAQLFRQSLKSEGEPSLLIDIQLENR
ncbi:N-glycanase Pngl [Osmia lignaria lignaria]|uniref:N-glycanase Pngl n=1 Tax=Osmia lignaria lignaria TaxID=1437193 RepID=UPI00402B857A